MQKAGYIEFVQDDNDKRKQRIILTDKAAEFDRSHAEESAAYMKRFTENQIVVYKRENRVAKTTGEKKFLT